MPAKYNKRIKNQYIRRKYLKAHRDEIIYKDLNRKPPSNIDAEKSVLAAIIIRSDKIFEIDKIVQPEDFFLPGHQILYKTLLDLIKPGSEIDLVTLNSELEKLDLIDSVGGISYIVGLTERQPAKHMIKTHAEIIKNHSIKRKLIARSKELITQCTDENLDAKDSDKIINMAKDFRGDISEISSERYKTKTTTLKSSIKKVINAANPYSEKKRDDIKTGFSGIDSIASGIKKKEIFILAARPSMGKTTLAINIAINAAKKGTKVAIISLEMTSEKLVLKMLAAETMLSANAIIKNFNVTGSKEFWKSGDAADILNPLNIHIIEDCSNEIGQILANCRKVKRERNIDFIVIDYLQLISDPYNQEQRNLELSSISGKLKAVTAELDIGLLLLSQLSRGPERRNDKRPLLSDLRGSGAIEQDADIVAFLYRDVMYDKNTDYPNNAELIIAKNRNGATGTIMLEFEPEKSKFTDGTFRW